MSHATKFGIISGEMVGCPATKTKKEIVGMAKTAEIVQLADNHKEDIQKGSTFNVGPSGNMSPFWSLLANTSWTLDKPAVDQIRTIFAWAKEESKGTVLEARKNLLLSKHTMELRFDLWVKHQPVATVQPDGTSLRKRWSN